MTSTWWWHMATRRPAGVVALALGWCVACGTAGDGASDALLRADSAFAAATAERGADGWADFFLATGVQFPFSGRIDGREAIRGAMTGAFDPGEPRLLWAPTEAHVGAGDDLGYTLGRWQTVLTTASGRDSVIGEGHYVTVWRRAPDGAWRVAVDIGNRDAP